LTLLEHNFHVLDTGILSSHTQFGGRVVPGYNWVDASDTEDCSGHGAHCAGTIGGKDYGICKHCKLIAVKVLLGCDLEGTWTTVIAGLDWAITHAMSSGIPSVISLSFDGAFNSFVNDMISTAVDLGIVVVVSAGNGYDDASFYSPASSPAAITFGAVSLSGAKSSYSNFGKGVDIFAPGDNITSAFIGEGNRSFKDLSGTSMAAPHVAGVAALYRAFNPSKSAYEVRDFIVGQMATVNAISGLDSNSPNRLLYSRFDEWTKPYATLQPPIPTLPPSSQPPTLQVFSKNLVIQPSVKQYLGREFAVSASQRINGDFFLVSAGSGSGSDLDLYLEFKVGNSWRSRMFSTSARNEESASFLSLVNAIYRWRIVSFRIQQSSFEITFRSNILQSIDFAAENSLFIAPSYSANLLLSSNIVRNYVSREFVAGFGDMITGQFSALSPIDQNLDLILGRWDGAANRWFDLSRSRNPGNEEFVSYRSLMKGVYRWRIAVSTVPPRNLTFTSNYNAISFFLP
jgi:hypothetical protein